MKEALRNNPDLCDAVDENVEEISEYVMMHMNGPILEYALDHTSELSPEEQNLERQIKMIEKASPGDFGFTEEELHDTSWKSVINEIKKIKEFKTPRTKLN